MDSPAIILFPLEPLLVRTHNGGVGRHAIMVSATPPPWLFTAGYRDSLCPGSRRPALADSARKRPTATDPTPLAVSCNPAKGSISCHGLTPRSGWLLGPWMTDYAASADSAEQVLGDCGGTRAIRTVSEKHTARAARHPCGDALAFVPTLAWPQRDAAGSCGEIGNQLIERFPCGQTAVTLSIPGHSKERMSCGK